MRKAKEIINRKSWQDQTEVWRAKIASSQVLHRLIQCAEGKLELNGNQIKCGLGLLSKVMPELSAATITHRKEDVSPAEMLERLKQVMGDQLPIDGIARLEQEYLPNPDKLN